MPQPLRFVLLLLPVVIVVLAAGAVAAGELIDPGTSIEQAIDHYVDQQNETQGRPVVPAADSEVVLRRTWLDLAGRIPTSAEREWFLQLPESERRERLVDRTLAGFEFRAHLRDVLDDLLLPNRPYHQEFRDYLLWAIEQRRPWDAMFRDLILPEQSEMPAAGAAEFLRSRVRELDDVTNDTSVLLFGVNVSCAKCHDHPLVEDWKQDHYYGMQAFFNRTFLSKTNKLFEKPFGTVSFKTTGGEEKPASLMFLNGACIDDASPEYSDESRKELEETIRKLEREDDPGVTLEPEFSPRAQLVSVVLADEMQFLAKNIVNRTWQRLCGVGLVDPPDQLHSGNPASHPELLNWLARDFVAHDYDLVRLIRGVVLSRTYARSSDWTSQDEPPPAQSFAVGMVRPLTPPQLALSLLVAVQNPERWHGDESAVERHLRELRQHSEGWSREFETTGPGFQVSVDEALFFSNSDRIQNDLLRPGDDRLTGVLQQQTDDAAAVVLLWETVFGRAPSGEERQAAVEFLHRPDVVRNECLRDLLWAALASPEMRFNH